MAIATPMFWESIYTTGYTLYIICIYEREIPIVALIDPSEILQIYPSKSFLPFTAFPQPFKTAPRNSWLSKNPSPLRSKSWKMAPQ